MIDATRPKTLLACAAGLAILGGTLLSGAGYGSDQTPPAPMAAQSPPLAPAVLPSLLFAEQELLGRYYLGDGFGVNCALTLDAEHRFTFSWRGCLGEHDRNFGTWRLLGDVLEMKPEQPNICEGLKGMNLRFVPVKWGARVYLVDENETPGFCAAAGFDAFPVGNDVHGRDFVKTTVVPLPPLTGKPLLPQRFREFYDQGPVMASVAKLEAGGRVRLKPGRDGRLKTGMLLSSGTWELRVVEVGPRHAIAEVAYFWDSDRPVKVGHEFFSGDYLQRPRGTGAQRFPHLPPPGPRGACGD